MGEGRGEDDLWVVDKKAGECLVRDSNVLQGYNGEEQRAEEE